MSEDPRWPGMVGPGSVVAGYRIESWLGAGGMAVVFRARDERLGRMVALKVLGPQWAQDEQFRLRFIAESRAAAAVDDPHVIPVYEAGDAGGLLFIAMRLVAGSDLRDIMRREGAMAPARALELLSPVASALDAAHDAMLIHRDVKPGNILVHERPGRPDHVYLSDFGLSKSAASSAVSLTGSDQYLGTPQYSSPEQVQEGTVDGRADQYALACVAFEMLTGRVPFERDNGLAVLLAHLNEAPPSLTAWRPELPAADAVLARALAKSPGDRYSTCQEFIDELRGAVEKAARAAEGTAPPAIVGDEPGRPGDEGGVLGARYTPTEDLQAPAATADADVKTPPARFTRKRMTVIAAAAGVIVAAAIAVPLALAASASAPDSRPVPDVSHVPVGPASVSNAPSQAFDGPSGFSAENVVISPDGRTVAAADGSDSKKIYLVNPVTGEATATLTDPTGSRDKGVTSIAFSRDGRLLAAVGGDSLYLWNTGTHRIAVTLTAPRDQELASVAFSPDGRTVSAAGNNSSAGTDGRVYSWNIANHQETGTIVDPSGEFISNIAFSPDGRAIATSDSGSTDGKGSIIYLWNAATGQKNAALPVPHGVALSDVAFSPDDRTVAAAGSNNNNDIYLWNTATHQETGTLAEPKYSHDFDSGYFGLAHIAFSSDGSTVTAAGANDGNSLYLWSTVTHKKTATLTEPGDADLVAVVFSPDDRTIVTGDDEQGVSFWRVRVP